MNRREFLKIAAGSAAVLATLRQRGPAQAVRSRPNILVMLCDDMGWGQPGFQGGTKIPTPNLDRLAKDGVQLTQFYVQAVCSPTRACLMTGRYPFRTGTEERTHANDIAGMLLDERTLAQALKEAGYFTAIMGKWHLGQWKKEHLPMQRGFDHQYGHYSALIDSFTHTRGAVYDWRRNEQPLNEEGYSTFLIAAEVERLLQDRDKSRPFFFYVPFNAVHGPHQAPQEFLAKYDGRDAAQNAQLECMDIAIGRILNALDKKGLCNNTLTIFFNDNGGRERLGNGPYRGGKGSYYEGGVRVACLMRCPAKIKPGSVVDEPVHVVDLYPTLINRAGGSLEQKLRLDGLDVWATITKAKRSPRHEIVHNVPGSPRSGTAAIRRGDFKLVGNQLFNIKDDPYEQNDRADNYPEKVRELKERLAQFARERRKPEQHLKIPNYPPAVYGEQENKGQLPAWLLEKAQNARQNEKAIRSEKRAKRQRRNSK